MQTTCLLGDTDIFELYTELANKKFSYQALLEETDILTNLYYHQIRDGAQAIRIPTLHCTAEHTSFQKNEQTVSLESLINLLVSTAKKAIQKTEADILLIGVIGNFFDNKTKDVWQSLAEKTIYLADFGVDSIAIEGIQNWELFQKSLFVIQQQSNQPLCSFFPLEKLKKKELKEYQKLYDSLELELLGLELQPQDLKIWGPSLIELSQKVQLGFLLKNWNLKKEKELLIYFLKNCKLECLFGGAGTKRRWWNDFIYSFLSQNKKI